MTLIGQLDIWFAYLATWTSNLKLILPCGKIGVIATLLMLVYTNIITHTWQFPQYKVQLGHMHAARGLPQYTTGTHDVIMHKNYE